MADFIQRLLTWLNKPTSMFCMRYDVLRDKQGRYWEVQRNCGLTEWPPADPGLVKEVSANYVERMSRMRAQVPLNPEYLNEQNHG